MKIYRLKSWPDLPPSFKGMGYRRLLSNLSHRHMGELEIRDHCGLSSTEVRRLLSHLDSQHLLDTREVPDPEFPDSALPRLAWLAQSLQSLRRRAS